MEHMPSAGIQDYVPRDFFNVESVEARQISKRAHPHEADIVDGMIVFQNAKKQEQARSTNGRTAAMGNQAVIQRHNEGK